MREYKAIRRPVWGMSVEGKGGLGHRSGQKVRGSFTSWLAWQSMLNGVLLLVWQALTAGFGNGSFILDWFTNYLSFPAVLR